MAQGSTSSDRSKKSQRVKSAPPLSPDRSTIFDESAHIPDRDQMFGADHKHYPAPNPDIVGWEGDKEDQMVGDRDFKHDAVDDFETMRNISEPYHDPLTPSTTPTMVAPAGGSDKLNTLDDKELLERAEALGIAGRGDLTRAQLINALREAISLH